MRDNKGYDPTQMQATEQTAMAQQFVENYANPQHGINNNLQSPSNNLSSNSFSTPRIDTVGLERPDGSTVNINTVASHRAEVQSAIDNYNSHQGNVIGNQVLDQGNALHHMSGDTMDLIENCVRGAVNKLAKNDS